MLELVTRRCSAKKLCWKFRKIRRMQKNVAGLQAFNSINLYMRSISCTGCRISASIYNNNFTGTFQAFCIRPRSSHLESVRLIKIPENYMWRSSLVVKSYKKISLSNLLLYVFRLHFLRTHHDYFFEEALKLWEHSFFQENTNEK